MVTAAGTSAVATWDGVRAGKSAASRDPALDGSPIDISCRVPCFDAVQMVGRQTALMHDRFVQLALVAAREAMADAGLSAAAVSGARVGVMVGTALGGVSTWEEQHKRMIDGGPRNVSPLFIPLLMHNMVAGHIAMEFGATGPNLVTASACASGASAIGTAYHLIRDGTCDVVIAGGADASITPLIVAGFARMGVLSRRLAEPDRASRPFDVSRDGFVIGEGSGILILEAESHAHARGARIRARLAGYGASADAYHMTTPDPSGAGVRSAMNQALRTADLTADEIGYVNAHGTSTLVNDRTEARAITGLLGTGVAVSSTKGVTGHTLGAAGAIEAALSVLAVETGMAPPTANLDELDPEIDADIVAGRARPLPVRTALSNSSGFGGQNAVLAFTAA